MVEGVGRPERTLIFPQVMNLRIGFPEWFKQGEQPIELRLIETQSCGGQKERHEGSPLCPSGR